MSLLAAAGPSQAEVEELLVAGEQMRLQLQAVEEQRALMRDVLQDYQRGRDALQAFKAGVEEEVLVPIGGGNFVHARLAERDRVVMSLGSGVHAEGDVDRALERLGERIESANKAVERLAEESRRIGADLQRLNQHLQALSQGPPQE